MGADGGNLAEARHTGRLAPLPDHRHVAAPWWQELWSRHSHITTPLRLRGLGCDIEFGLSAYIVRVSLPDDSHLIIGPPQEPSSERPLGDPEGWIVTREHPDDQALFEVIYDSGTPDRPEAVHGGSIPPSSRRSTCGWTNSDCSNTPPTRGPLRPRGCFAGTPAGTRQPFSPSIRSRRSPCHSRS